MITLPIFMNILERTMYGLKTNVMYKVGQMLDCNAAEINFSNYHESFAIEQQGKTCVIAQKMLSSLEGTENVGIYPAQGKTVP